MRVIYKVGLGLGAIVAMAIAATIAALLYYHAHLTDIVVARFKQRTALDIRPARVAVHFGSHLIIEMDQPLVLDRTNQILQLNNLELYGSYHALLTSGGLPLYAIKLDQPRLRLEAPVQAVNISQLPQLDAAATKLLQLNVQRFSSLT